MPGGTILVEQFWVFSPSNFLFQKLSLTHAVLKKAFQERIVAFAQHFKRHLNKPLMWPLAVTGIAPGTGGTARILVELLRGLGAISCSAFKSHASRPESFWDGTFLAPKQTQPPRAEAFNKFWVFY